MPDDQSSGLSNRKIIGFDDELVVLINEWRRRQDDLPSFSDAVRELIRIGLDRASGARRKGGHRRHH
jgi:hypothetical protein